ncbi:MAG: hypothetical protein ACKO2Z_24445 [Sphaerospermopsis kisseleviana]
MIGKKINNAITNYQLPITNYQLPITNDKWIGLLYCDRYNLILLKD